MTIDIETARQIMIEQQIRPWEVLDPRVLETLATVSREDFVPARHRKLAFADLAIPLEHGEFMLKPAVEGRLLQALDLAPEHAVLEIGTGSGFFTACLSQLARAVTSVDIHTDFVERARSRFADQGCTNIELQVADALSFDPGRKFDVVCVTGAVAELPGHFSNWLRPGGRLVVVQGLSPMQEVLRLTLTATGLLGDSLFETDIPYLRGAEPTQSFVL